MRVQQEDLDSQDVYEKSTRDPLSLNKWRLISDERDRCRHNRRMARGIHLIYKLLHVSTIKESTTNEPDW